MDRHFAEFRIEDEQNTGCGSSHSVLIGLFIVKHVSSGLK